jgi:hypothetical protein
MKPAITELLNLIKGMSFDQAMTAIEKHFSENLSLESVEWNEKMSESERINLVKALINYSTK